MGIRIEQKIKLKHKLSLKQRFFLSTISLSSDSLFIFLKEFSEKNPFIEFSLPEKDFFEEVVGEEKSLTDDLVQQLRINVDSEQMIKTGEFIIYNLNEKGYLEISTSEIASILQVDEDIVEKSLKLVQSLNPPGIGARNLRESLLLQVKRKYPEDKILAKIFEECWELLTKRKFKEISKKLKISEDEVEEKIEKIKKLNPYPVGRGKVIRRIIPDVELVEKKDGFEIKLDEKIYPYLKLNDLYERMLKNPLISRKEKRYLEKQMKNARFIIEIMDKRRKLLKDIFQKIVNRQNDFFKGCPLLPLREKDIADQMNISISTVSRAVKGKYIKTPKGVIKIKDLFSHPFSENLSKDFVMRRIKEIISKGGKRFSDREIAEKLKKEGINISPRTVNKYRNQAGILNSYLR